MQQGIADLVNKAQTVQNSAAATAQVEGVTLIGSTKHSFAGYSRFLADHRKLARDDSSLPWLGSWHPEYQERDDWRDPCAVRQSEDHHRRGPPVSS